MHEDPLAFWIGVRNAIAIETIIGLIAWAILALRGI